MMIKSPEERFWDKVNKTDYCWLWTAGKVFDGYGQFVIKKNNVVRAHRFSWELHFGKIPKNFNILHKCDNRACVNPSHLFLGTQKDNINDMVIKERQQRGETSGRHKLTKSEVLDIRSRNNYWGIQQDLIKEFNVTSTTISNIINRKSWKHI